MSFQNCKIVTKGANPRDYHKQDVLPGLPDFVISSSSLREFFRCPSRWKAGYVSPDTQAKQFGELFDCLLLTPDQFSARYAVKPPTYTNEKGETKSWNGNANVCKAWLADHERMQIVSEGEVSEARQAMERLRSDAMLRAWHDASEYQVWVAGEWLDEDSKTVIPCRCLIDYVPRGDSEFAKCVGDLKTARTAMTLPFQRQAYQLGYHLQAAFDLDMLVAATGEDRNTWCWIVVENFAPWEVGRKLCGQSFLDLGRRTYTRALTRYARCLKTQVWPGYDDHADSIDGWSLVDAEPWMEFEDTREATAETQQQALAGTDEATDITP